MTASTQPAATAPSRHIFLSVMTALYGLLAISDLTKALQHTKDPAHLGIVIFGQRLETFSANAVAGPIFAVILAAYAYGLWTRKRWVFPLSVTYAFYVPVNLVLFWSQNVGPRPSLRFILFYLAVSLTGSIGTAIYLAYHRDELA